MRLIIRTMAIACGLTLVAASQAAAPAAAPAGSTGLCKDGSYYSGATKKGACKGHKGVKEWWGEKESKPAKGAKGTEAAAPASESASAPAPAAKPAGTHVASAAAGGGADKVWVNTESKVYHCQGDRWYGKTKAGEYMTEAEAAAKGYRADRGKACK